MIVIITSVNVDQLYLFVQESWGTERGSADGNNIIRKAQLMAVNFKIKILLIFLY